jgi:hypothetical protein
MTRGTHILAFAGAALAGAASLGADRPAPKPVSGGIEWVFDHEEGRKLARASGKPLFVVFRCEQ